MAQVQPENFSNAEGSAAVRRARVWDPFLRLFHWSLVAAIAIGAITGFLARAPWIDLHIWSGAAAAALVALRIVWGFLGPTHARFTDFVVGPAALIRHLRDLAAGHVARHRGHNPLGGVMILALMLIVAAIVATGLVVLGGALKAGPFAFATDFATGWSVRGVHKLLSLLLLGLIALHVAGALFESRRTGENLARAMIDGEKERRAGDHRSIPLRARPWLAAALSVALLGGAAVGLWSLAQRPALGAPAAPLDPVYASECGDCHIPYHPSLLPRASWAALMAGLDDHFGENASLGAATAEAIGAYLQANAAEAYDTLPANRLRKVESEQPYTITKTPFWRRMHRRLPETVFQSSAVRRRGNCEACHGDARTGRFYPGAIEIPEEADL